MTGFLLRRLATAVATVFVVSLAVFLMARVAGDPRSVFLGENASQEQWEEFGRRLGLDRPLYVQYADYLRRLVAGDLGQSITYNRPAFDVIIDRVPATLELAAFAFAISTVAGIGLGILAAVRRGTLLDRISQVIALVGQAMPSFLLGIVMIYVFAVALRWLPVSGRREWNSFVLPGATLGWFFIAANMRLMRSSMLDTLGAEYVKMARAKGMPWRNVVLKHALRNALIPTITFAGVTLGSLVTGSLVVETVFAWPGLGQLAVQSVFASDYPLLQGTVVVFTVIYMLAALAVDVLYVYIDPRVRYR
jgi:peptide/nickel transport system permease protein